MDAFSYVSGLTSIVLALGVAFILVDVGRLMEKRFFGLRGVVLFMWFVVSAVCFLWCYKMTRVRSLFCHHHYHHLSWGEGAIGFGGFAAHALMLIKICKIQTSPAQTDTAEHI
jgi:hypothetical protein